MHIPDVISRLTTWCHSPQAESAQDLMDEAAREIARLRSCRDMAEADRDVAMLAAERMRLTDEEREAIEKAISRELDCDWYGGPEPARVVTLRGMLERTK